MVAECPSVSRDEAATGFAVGWMGQARCLAVHGMDANAGVEFQQRIRVFCEKPDRRDIGRGTKDRLKSPLVQVVERLGHPLENVVALCGLEVPPGRFPKPQAGEACLTEMVEHPEPFVPGLVLRVDAGSE